MLFTVSDKLVARIRVSSKFQNDDVEQESGDVDCIQQESGDDCDAEQECGDHGGNHAEIG